MQSGAIASARAEMPPRDYFTDEIRRQLSAKLGDEELFTGGLTIRATVDPDLQSVAARGAARRPRAVRPRHHASTAARSRRSTRRASTRPTRRAGAGRSAPPRCRATSTAGTRRWCSRSARARPASASRASPEDADGHFLAFDDASWAPDRAATTAGCAPPQGPDDMWDVGDVVFVEAVETDGASTAGPTARSRRSRAASWRWTPRPAASSPCRAASPTSRASSTAPPRRCASPARRSSPSSTPRRSTAATARRRSCSTRRSRWRPAPASGRRRTRAATTTARRRSAPASSSRAT